MFLFRQNGYLYNFAALPFTHHKHERLDGRCYCPWSWWFTSHRRPSSDVRSNGARRLERFPTGRWLFLLLGSAHLLGQQDYFLRWIPQLYDRLRFWNGRLCHHSTGGDFTLYHYGEQLPTSSVPLAVSVEISERNFVLPSGLPASRDNLLVALWNIRAIYIRGSYSDPTREARLSSVTMDIAVKELVENADVAVAVEQCGCPANYQGTSCEDCAPGHFRAHTGPYGGFCVPCQCHGHSDTCDPITGKCFDCKDNTVGDHCEKCDVGYQGDATQGTPSDCLICACPLPIASNNFALTCDFSPEGTEIACKCKPGYTGPLCESCAPGFYGQPEVIGDYCKPCNCSNNIDVDDPQACDSVSGDCLKCLNNAFGPACGLCAPGFYGDAVELKDCQACHCDE